MTRRRRDLNQKPIVKSGRKAGYKIWILADLGGGVPDTLWLSHTHIPVLIEIKEPGEDFTPAQRVFFEEYDGPKAVAMTPESALATMAYYDEMTMECK